MGGEGCPGGKRGEGLRNERDEKRAASTEGRTGERKREGHGSDRLKGYKSREHEQIEGAMLPHDPIRQVSLRLNGRRMLQHTYEKITRSQTFRMRNIEGRKRERMDRTPTEVCCCFAGGIKMPTSYKSRP